MMSVVPTGGSRDGAGFGGSYSCVFQVSGLLSLNSQNHTCCNAASFETTAAGSDCTGSLWIFRVHATDFDNGPTGATLRRQEGLRFSHTRAVAVLTLMASPAFVNVQRSGLTFQRRGASRGRWTV